MAGRVLFSKIKGFRQIPRSSPKDIATKKDGYELRLEMKEVEYTLDREIKELEEKLPTIFASAKSSFGDHEKVNEIALMRADILCTRYHLVAAFVFTAMLARQYFEKKNDKAEEAHQTHQ